jgi:hypothetical protein
MLISYEEPKLIFIHIQKTGGVSISDLLGRFVPTTIQGRSCRHMSARRALKQVITSSSLLFAIRGIGSFRGTP